MTVRSDPVGADPSRVVGIFTGCFPKCHLSLVHSNYLFQGWLMMYSMSNEGCWEAPFNPSNTSIIGEIPVPILAIQSTTNLLITHPDTYFEHQVNILPYLHHQRSEYQDTTHSKDPGKQHVQRPFLGATRAFCQTIKREVRPNPCQPTMVQVGNFFSPPKNRNWNICSMEIPLYSLDTLFSLHVHLLVKMSSHQKPHKRKLQKTRGPV